MEKYLIGAARWTTASVRRSNVRRGKEEGKKELVKEMSKVGQKERKDEKIRRKGHEIR